MNMMTEYIYLLQEREFIKTNESIYKVGMTKKENHWRFNQYPKGSILLFQMICNDCNNIEKQILKFFKEMFNQRKDIGTEYFEGNYKDMIDIIYSTIKDNDKKVKDNSEDENLINKIYKNVYKNACEKIHKIFPDYKNDISFGGEKKYIIINESDVYKYEVSYIEPNFNKNLKDYCNDIIKKSSDDECDETFEDCINSWDHHGDLSNTFQYYDELEYIKMLIDKKIIILNKIYDLYSPQFITKILKTKVNISIENYDEFKNEYSLTLNKKNDDWIENAEKESDAQENEANAKNDWLKKILMKNNEEKRQHIRDAKARCKINERLRQLLYSSLIINDNIYSTMCEDDFKNFKKKRDFSYFFVEVGVENREKEEITLYKIHDKYYDYKTFLREYIPYFIEWVDDNHYIIYNRDYKYIGPNKKPNYEYISTNKKNEGFLFDDGCVPIDDMTHYVKFCNKFKSIVNDTECLNPYYLTNILTLFD
jgi:hypothetical protein